MQAIQTRWIAATNNQNNRVKAFCPAGSVTVEWDSDLNVDDNHHKAAQVLQTKLQWTGPRYGTLHGGTLKNGDFAWVLVPEFVVKTMHDAIKANADAIARNR